MKTSKDNCLNIGRDDITPTAFMHVPRAPDRSDDQWGNQCNFGLAARRAAAVSRYMPNGFLSIAVYRDSEKDAGELTVTLGGSGLGRQETRLQLTADEMQTLACALLDAAHHLRTVPAAPYVWTDKTTAEAVPA